MAAKQQTHTGMPSRATFLAWKVFVEEAELSVVY